MTSAKKQNPVEKMKAQLGSAHPQAEGTIDEAYETMRGVIAKFREVGKRDEKYKEAMQEAQILAEQDVLTVQEAAQRLEEKLLEIGIQPITANAVAATFEKSFTSRDNG